MYFYCKQLVKKYIQRPIVTFLKQSCDHNVTQIDEYDVSLLKKHCVFRLSPIMMIYGAFLSVFIDSKKWHEQYLSKTISNLKNSYNSSNGDKIFIFTFYNGKQVISKVPSVPSQSLSNYTPKRKWLMVLVNGSIDITSFYKNTIGSIEKHLSVTARELAGLALYDKVDSLSLIAIAMNPLTYISAIDDNTFEERVFKGTDIVEL